MIHLALAAAILAPLGFAGSSPGLHFTATTAVVRSVKVVNEGMTPSARLNPFGGRIVPIGPRINERDRDFELDRALTGPAPLDTGNGAELMRSAAFAAASGPKLLANFPGMNKQVSNGLVPPDMGLAASPTMLLQTTNSSVSLFDHTGVLATGWPKDSAAFVGLKTGTFNGDLRTVYDAATHHWIVMTEDFNNSLYLAVSQTDNPAGTWTVYTITLGGNDYCSIAVDASAIYLTAPNGNNYQATVLAAPKATLEAGKKITSIAGFNAFSYNGKIIDVVQPTLPRNEGSNPVEGMFVANIDNAGNCSPVCTNVAVFHMANPGTAGQTLTGAVVTTLPYTTAPSASVPKCGGCVETLDTRISATPVYDVSGNTIYFASETAVSNGGTNTAGILWTGIQPKLTGGALTGATIVQNGILSFPKAQVASFGTLNVDSRHNLYMTIDTMGPKLYPGAMVVARKSTDPANKFTSMKTLVTGTAYDNDGRWGDYSATAFDGTQMWFANQWDNDPANWNTEITSLTL